MGEAVILADISILEDKVPMKNTGSNEKRKTKLFRTYCYFFVHVLQQFKLLDNKAVSLRGHFL